MFNLVASKRSFEKEFRALAEFKTARQLFRVVQTLPENLFMEVLLILDVHIIYVVRGRWLISNFESISFGSSYGKQSSGGRLLAILIVESTLFLDMIMLDFIQLMITLVFCRKSWKRPVRGLELTTAYIERRVLRKTKSGEITPLELSNATTWKPINASWRKDFVRDTFCHSA